MLNIFGYKQFKFNFIGRRLLWYIIALVFIVPGMVMLAVNGLNLGIDFTGGSVLEVAYEQETALEDVREIVASMVEQTPAVNESNANQFYIRTIELEEEESQALIAALEELGPLTVMKTERIGPVIGSELLRSARWAILIAGVLMLLYITFRFKFDFALTAILALAHDVLVLLSIFAIFRIEVNSYFIAAVLTIVGYSINNTIVIFDRIRENSRFTGKKDYPQLINTSINQTLTRTINTVLAVLILLFALYILGGDTTKTFVLALIIGMFAGFFSSVFLVGNFLNDIIRKLGHDFSAAKSARQPVKKKAAVRH
ncbi:MAG: protein translocase subunit SecF [Bacillota bacterium]|nr:protein translocase subunit SecF [Bacillota bacterium]